MKTYRAWASKQGYDFCTVEVKAKNISEARRYFSENGFILDSRVYLVK